MSDFYLVLELVGLITFSAVVLYFLVWNEPATHVDRQRPRATESAARARART